MCNHQHVVQKSVMTFLASSYCCLSAYRSAPSQQWLNKKMVGRLNAYHRLSLLVLSVFPSGNGSELCKSDVTESPQG